MYLHVSAIDLASFNDFDILVWNCSGNVILLVFHFIMFYINLVINA